MATNKDPIFLNTVATANVSIANADGTTDQDIFTAGADGGAVTNLSATTTDTSAVIAVLKVNDGSTDIVIGEVSVPAGSGTDGSSPTVNLLSATALPGVLQADGSLALGANAILSVAAKSAVTAAKTFDVMAVGGSYSA